MVQRLFDQALYRRRQARAQAAGPCEFLRDRVGAEFTHRLSLINREFARALDISTRPLPALPNVGKELLVHLPVVAGAGGQGVMAVASSEALPVAPAVFDLVLSGLALHAIDDLPGALAQIQVVLKPDGLFMAAMFGGDTLGELKMALAAAESEVIDGVTLRIAPFATLRDVGGLLQRAGFTLAVVDRDEITVRYASPLSLMHDLRAMGETNILHGRSRAPLRRQVLERAMAIYQERFADPDGKIRATFEIFHLSGWRPHSSQQQPLRPGSARRHLSEVLPGPKL
ncbi:MAG: methyltransferase domain-containing protein [Alphaproteobacteria bacterium]